MKTFPIILLCGQHLGSYLSTGAVDHPKLTTLLMLLQVLIKQEFRTAHTATLHWSMRAFEFMSPFSLPRNDCSTFGSLFIPCDAQHPIFCYEKKTLNKKKKLSLDTFPSSSSNNSTTLQVMVKRTCMHFAFFYLVCGHALLICASHLSYFMTSSQPAEGHFILTFSPISAFTRGWGTKVLLGTTTLHIGHLILLLYLSFGGFRM